MGWQPTGGGSSPLTTKGDVFGYSTVDARIPVGTNDHVLTADSAQTLGVKWAAGGSGASWGDYTPTYDNLTVGNGTVTARKVQNGTVVHVYFRFVLGSTSSVGAAGVSVPHTAASIYGENSVGTAAALNSGVQRYNGNVYINGSGKFGIFWYNTSATYITGSGINTTIPFTWGTSDEFSFSATYEST